MPKVIFKYLYLHGKISNTFDFIIQKPYVTFKCIMHFLSFKYPEEVSGDCTYVSIIWVIKDLEWMI